MTQGLVTDCQPAPRAKVAGGPGAANVAANAVEPHGNQTYTLLP